jgi:hypothetical protein
MSKLLIESYYKWLTKIPKYFKSPLLNLDRAGFIQLNITERSTNEKTKDLIEAELLFRQIKSGHIVYRTLKDGWGWPHIQIFYNKRILDKYGNQIE